MRTLNSKEEFQQAINQENPTMVMFKADWCPDCTFLTPFIGEIEEEFSGDLMFYQIEMDQVEEPFAEHAVAGIPSFITFRSGKEVLRFVSRYRKTRGEIEDYLREAVAKAQVA